MDSKVTLLLGILIVILITQAEAGASKKKPSLRQLLVTKTEVDKKARKKPVKPILKDGLLQSDVSAADDKDDQELDDDIKYYYDDGDENGDRNHGNEKDYSASGSNVKMICLPGRTVLKAKAGFHPPPDPEYDGDYDDVDPQRDTDQKGDANRLRSHMNHGKKGPDEDYVDLDCEVCVCAVNGIDEYCSTRPARNINECMRVQKANKDMVMNIPFEADRNLAHRIRRDLIWHKNEIPYNAKARCTRGFSYYTNSVSANDTDIDVASDVDFLLDYSNNDTCYYCICSVSGEAAGCLTRDPYFCDYYRSLRPRYINDTWSYDHAARAEYHALFLKDVPTYYRALSYRLRRTMDRNVFELYESVGKNLVDPTCIPFVSEYSDCTRENLCSGCTKCTCSGDAEWDCEKVSVCETMNYDAKLKEISADDLEAAVGILQNALKLKRITPEKSTKAKEDVLLGLYGRGNLRRRFRPRRSAVSNDTSAINNTVTFYETIDEINEDTLKNNNYSGTITAKKMQVLNNPTITNRRSGLETANSSKPLLIQYSKSKIPNSQLADHKVDATIHGDDKLTKDHEILSTNQTAKDTELTKLVVNEINKGTETIGDGNAPVVSNITFTPENDTLTAMTFIAGNLLSELWHMEKDASGESIETEVLRHEKIKDLLDLFKEPLTLKQESILKFALEKLSNAMIAHEVKNISICEEMQEVQNQLKLNQPNLAKNEDENNNITNTKTIVQKKINNVLEMLGKFEQIRKVLHTLKSDQFQPNIGHNNRKKFDSKEPLTVFGKLYEKVTKLLLPNKNGKRLVNKMKAQNVFRTNQDVAEKVKILFGIDVDINNMTAKDKIVLDYVRRMERNPECLLGKQLTPLSPMQKMEGDILLNLSEFFKLKSFSDLVKLVQTEIPTTIEPTTKTPKTTTEALIIESKEDVEEMPEPKAFLRSNSNVGNMKAKLKEHLVAVINDIVEMQNENQLLANDPRIASALPCIYNLLEADKNTGIKTVFKEPQKVAPIEDKGPILSGRRNLDIDNFFENFKKDLVAAYNPKAKSGGRRSYQESNPDSVKVIERLIKNALYSGPSGRRFNDVNSIENVKAIIENSEFQKYDVMQSLMQKKEIHPADRMAALKHIQLDVKKYIDILERVKKSNYFQSQKEFNDDDDVVDFLTDAKLNLETDKLILNKVNKSKPNKPTALPPKSVNLSMNIPKKPAPPIVTRKFAGADAKIFSRDQISTQLIKNRLNLYLKLKESSGDNLNFDTSYHIARRVLKNIDDGNFNIAKELFKVFLNRNQNEQPEFVIPDDRSVLNLNTAPRGPTVLAFKEPLIRLEDPKPSYENPRWTYQDQLIKQFMNMKNI